LLSTSEDDDGCDDEVPGQSMSSIEVKLNFFLRSDMDGIDRL
jgi:hypothetical protein